ncbi:MAG: LPS export ABC transporter ATP-binding protein [Armatimonadia bacterium]|nr:LPS export ABC transporter ATP-binding protein [Armatimonadia bacterium]
MRSAPELTQLDLFTENLVKRYGGRRVVDEVSVGLDRGEVVGLLGPNGAGKTTSFYMVVGLIQPNQGHVYLDGEDITRFRMHRRARRGIGYLAQSSSVFRKLSVWDNIMAILELQPLSKAERVARCAELLDRLKVGQLKESMGESLSGGERRRVEIARCLASDPSFILLDEPFTGVDPKAIQDIQEIVFELKEDGIGILITDHSFRETLEITDRAYIIFDGKLQTHGTPAELVHDEAAQRLYFGDALTRGLRIKGTEA